MHISAMITRLRRALADAAAPLSYRRENDPQVASGKRSKPRKISRPRSYSVSRTNYEDESAPVQIHVPPKRREDGKIPLEDRRELARILGVKVTKIPANGLEAGPDELPRLIRTAEAAARRAKRAKKKATARA